MRIVRKLVLLASMAIAATAFAAPSAFAATAPQGDGRSLEPQLPHSSPELQTRAEPGGLLCPAVSPAPGTNPAPHITAGGCKVHGRGNAIRLGAHISGGVEVQVSNCDVEVELRLNSTGGGWITHQELTDVVAGSCTREPCPEVPEPAEPAEAKAWGFAPRETQAVGQTRATVLFCLVSRNDPHGPQSHCEVELPFTETEGGIATNHRYHSNAGVNDPVTGGVPCHHNPTTEEPRAEIFGEANAEMVDSAAGPEGGVVERRIEINHT